jgi:hypothetical protein
MKPQPPLLAAVRVMVQRPWIAFGFSIGAILLASQPLAHVTVRYDSAVGWFFEVEVEIQPRSVYKVGEKLEKLYQAK